MNPAFTALEMLSADIIRFIQEHQETDPQRLTLAGKDIFGYPASFVADQIGARQRQPKRLPTFVGDARTIFPPARNLEQCSSEATAGIKAGLILEWSTGKPLRHLTDLTAGFGIDAFAFSGIFERVTLVEPDERLLRIAAHNFQLFGKHHAEFINATAAEHLTRTSSAPDWVYVDPSRRDQGRRVFRLEDCEPDMTALAPLMSNDGHEPEILLKASPMADITQVMRALPGVAHIAVVAVTNECRELLFHIRRHHTEPVEIICLDLRRNGSVSRFSFTREEEQYAEPAYAEPMRYLFEPNAAILKAGAFKLLAERTGLHRMDPNTHLLTGDTLPEGFPGRVLEIIRPIGDREPDLAADVLVRNHPLRPSEVVRRYGFREGGADVVVAFRSRTKKFVLLTRRTGAPDPSTPGQPKKE